MSSRQRESAECVFGIYSLPADPGWRADFQPERHSETQRGHLRPQTGGTQRTGPSCSIGLVRGSPPPLLASRFLPHPFLRTICGKQRRCRVPSWPRRGVPWLLRLRAAYHMLLLLPHCVPWLSCCMARYLPRLVHRVLGLRAAFNGDGDGGRCGRTPNGWERLLVGRSSSRHRCSCASCAACA